ncbi:MAG: hypothetical protein COB02_08290 [Candidatus Cloacimonadota bacterium]|nr:MAG: hypothetical protein COB02_08290 [Candidatus Cloacimonadota bacterium]
MNTVLDLGTKHLRALSFDKKGTTDFQLIGTSLNQRKEFDLSLFFKDYEKLLNSSKLDFLKNSVIDCLLPSSFFNYQINISDKKSKDYSYDIKTDKYYQFNVHLDQNLQTKTNSLFSLFQIEIDYLGSSLICDLQEVLDISKTNHQLYFFANLSHSSLYFFTIRNGIILNFSQNEHLCSKNLDSFLNDEILIENKNPFNEKLLFLPSIHKVQNQVSDFKKLSPYLKKLLSFFHEIIQEQEDYLKSSVDEIILSGGGFQFKYFNQFIQQMTLYSCQKLSSTTLKQENLDKELLYSPLLHFYNRRKSGLT